MSNGVEFELQSLDDQERDKFGGNLANFTVNNQCLAQSGDTFNQNILKSGADAAKKLPDLRESSQNSQFGPARARQTSFKRISANR